MTLFDNQVKTQSWVKYIALIGLIALFAGLFADASHQITKQKFGAFDTFYPAATALREGRDPYLETQTRLSDGRIPYLYPPLYAFLLQPLTLLSRASAARVMLAINGGCIIAALLLSARMMLGRLGAKVNAANTLGVALLTAIVAVVPIHNELRGLETNSILLLSFVLGLYCLDRWPILSGLALAVAINIKYLPVIALPYFLMRRRWTAVVATLLWTIALAVLPATTVGWSANGRYLQYAVGGLLRLVGVQTAGPSAQVHATDVESSISVASALSRLMTVAHAPKAVGLLLTAAVAAVWGLGILLVYRRRRLPLFAWPDAAKQRNNPYPALLAIEWGALVVFALVFSPNTQNRNLVMAIVPAAVGAALLACQHARARRTPWMLLLALTVMCSCLVLPTASMGRPFTDAWISTGAAAWGLLVTYCVIAWAALSTLPGAETVDNLGQGDPLSSSPRNSRYPHFS